jgi:16S rRNA (uracil1498-N3)-methyltransferase
MATRPGSVAGPPSRPDPTLQSVAAMVFVDDPAAPLLTPDDAHHLLDVLRLRPGELVAAGDGSGSWSPCRIAPVKPGRASRRVDPADVVTVDGPVVREPRATPEITVAFAPTKGDRPEWVVQKLTELGVDRIVPIHAARSVVRWDGERGQRAVARLSRVAREAAAQARRTWLPEISQVTTLGELASSGLTLRLALPGGAVPTLVPAVVAVGPEGGWDPDEAALSGGGVGLGPTVLRAETAAVAVGTLLCGLRSGLIAPLA